MRLVTAGNARNFQGAVVGRLATAEVAHSERAKTIRLFGYGMTQTSDLSGYLGVLSHDEISTDRPVVDRLRESDHFQSGDVISMDGSSGFVRSLYRPREKHHSLFVTERCSSNCLMCSQPPKDRDDVEFHFKRNSELISLMEPAPDYLTITGGEPTLLGDKLFDLLELLKSNLPETELHILTNGRTFAWPQFAQNFASVGHPNVSLGIPLYSDNPGDHDYVVQAKGAFDQTVTGLHQAARNNIRVEIRVVLHRLTIPRLRRLVEFIYRNLTFVEHIALMGLEYTGYTPRNIEELWIDPVDYQDELESAVRFLVERNMIVSIYNHQLCVLRKSLWPYAQKSISDWKNLYLPECQVCSELGSCGGLFQWAVKQRSRSIHSL